MKSHLINYLRSGQPALYFITPEEARAITLWKDVAREAGRARVHFNLFRWTASSGLTSCEAATEESPTFQIGDLNIPKDGARIVNPVGAHQIEVLDLFGALPGMDKEGDTEASILLLLDYHLFLGKPDGSEPVNPLLLRKFKEAIALGKATNRTLVIVGCQQILPPELAKEMVVCELPLPTRAELTPILEGIAHCAGIHLNGNREDILDAASGLTGNEAENTFALAKVETEEKTGTADICPRIVSREKAKALQKSGILEVVDSNLTFDDLGGLGEGKAFTLKRRHAYTPEARKFGLPTPKGVMVVGFSGTGKSLFAKCVSNVFGCPLLRLDCGKIFGGIVGQSEGNIRSALATAEAIGRCVLWLDEVEKGMSGSASSGQTDGGTSARVFGTFLTWMQEKKSPVFVVATANDVSKLPPEFLRKGRFDEIFFVDIPTPIEREQIWAVQLRKYGRTQRVGTQSSASPSYDLPRLAACTEGFTGSEIEALLVECLYHEFDQSEGKGDFEERTAELLAPKMIPLSRMMAEQLATLRQWAEGRCRPAGGTAAPALNLVAKGRRLA